jgi:SAM-dependent methyltransferase
MSEIQIKKEYKWIRFTSCPSCKSELYTVSSAILEKEYSYQNILIPIPDKGVGFKQCRQCSLIYKDKILSSESLSMVMDSLNNCIWSKGYDYTQEVKLVKKFILKNDIDILEIGATGGWFLKSFADYGGRRSGLDITKDPSIDASLRGEFIEGFIDSSNLDWSKKKYDVVGFFDVIEHLYNPRAAFSNLVQLVKDDGIVILETGDVESAWPARFGMEKWWYAKLFPHNLFWSRKSLTMIAEEYGFEVHFYRNKRNKNIKNLPSADRLKSYVKSSVYWLSPISYLYLMKVFNRQPVMPRNFLAKDHIQIILKKVKT